MDSQPLDPGTPAGQPPPKQTPPARDASFFRIPDRKPAHRRLYRRPTHIQSQLAFALFLVSVGAFVASGFLIYTPGIVRTIAAFVGFLSVPAFFGSLILAIVGLIECTKHPERYRGKALSITTLALGISLIFLFVASIVHARRRNERPAASPQLAVNNAGIFRFDYLNFAFRAPGATWQQKDPRIFGRNPVLAFVRNGPIMFTLCASKIEPGILDPRGRAVEVSQMSLRNAATSYKLVRQAETVHNGLAGWETETQATVHGHDFYFVSWVLVTNGCAYELLVWGPPPLAYQVRDAADELFPNFEPIVHQS